MVPFIPWDHQIPVIQELRSTLGYSDVGLDKSRGEGASWIAVLMALHDWLFEPMSAIGIVSRNEETADSPSDPASLMWKLDWELTKLPSWLAGKKDKDFERNLAKHSLRNLRNGSTITAYAATENTGRAGRYKWFLMDELAFFPRGADQRAVTSTQAASDSRLYISTPNGSEGSFYEIMHNPSSMAKLKMHWSQNPSRNRGLYKFVKGKIVPQDPEGNPLPENYYEDHLDMFSRLRKRGFHLEKGWRSPWYDKECDRPGATPQDIAQELDIDYAGSKHLVFGNEFFEKAEKTIRNPTHKGLINLHPETHAVDFEKLWDGQVKLWCELDAKGRPPRGSYVVSADVSSGLGGSYTSNSVIEVIDLNTREQVLEYATNTIQPSDFADICIGVSQWFWEAYLAWEHNGPGAGMTRRVIDRQYGNIFKRLVVEKQGRKKSKALGWWTDEKSKEVMFAELIRQVKQGEIVVRSKELLTECRQYIMANGKIEHAISISTQDDSSKGKAHGDRVIALGVGIQAAKDRPLENLYENRRTEENPPMNTVAWRLKEYERENTKDLDGWVDETYGASPTRNTFLVGDDSAWAG